jgi:hypothetical protein
MTVINFDVNDSKLREMFLGQLLTNCISYLPEQSKPLWGKMTPQHMIEHLVWAFECSTGAIELPCYTPESLLGRTKKFLYDNRQTPHDFKNPSLGENPPPLRFSSFADAKDTLHKELINFIEHFQEQPSAIHVHPIFGPIGAEEWQRSHFKHCYHHLEQFGLISQPKTVLS